MVYFFHIYFFYHYQFVYLYFSVFQLVSSNCFSLFTYYAFLPAFILDSVLDSLGGDRPLPLTKRHRNDLATLVIVARELVEVLQRVLATGQNEHEGPAGHRVPVARVQTEWRRIDEARSDLIAHKLLHAHVHLAGLQNLQQCQLLELVEPYG